jgi:hypothetical protein
MGKLFLILFIFLTLTAFPKDIRDIEEHKERKFIDHLMPEMHIHLPERADVPDTLEYWEHKRDNFPSLWIDSDRGCGSGENSYSGRGDGGSHDMSIN